MLTHRLLGLSPVLLCIAAAPANNPAQAVAQANSSAIQAAPTSAAGSAPAGAEEPKICKQLPSSYSRLPNRACLTKKQWDELKKEQDQY
jgi:hypothetical protein